MDRNPEQQLYTKHFLWKGVIPALVIAALSGAAALAYYAKATAPAAVSPAETGEISLTLQQLSRDMTVVAEKLAAAGGLPTTIATTPSLTPAFALIALGLACAGLWLAFFWRKMAFQNSSKPFQNASSTTVQNISPDENPPENENAATAVQNVSTFQNVSRCAPDPDDEKSTDVYTERSKMVEEAKAKELFFATMSHEIRTPMNAVLGMTELLLSEPLTEKQLNCVKDIKAASQALLTIVNDILDLSKLQAGELSLIPVHFELPRLLDNISSMAFFLAKEKSLYFNFTCARAVPDCLYGDDVRLRQVLLNIVGNAIKFTKKGEVALSVNLDGDCIVFEVTDTGIGIREEDIPGLFDAFKQADVKKNRTIIGTGLGLAITKILVERMGGTIRVQSEYGKGSTFSVRLPFTAGDPDKVEQEDGLLVEFSPNAKILVVDDKEVNLRVAKGLIELFNIECHVAASGEQAVAMAKKEYYDLIFMDHLMPEMDGLETTRRIRELGGRRTTLPIIALSATADMGARALFLDSGMNDFLPKPIERRRLQTILSKWMPRNDSTRVIGQRQRSETESRKKTEPAATEEYPTATTMFGDRRPRTLAEMAQNIPGLDVTMGLKQVSGQQDMYEEILNIACETMPALIESIETAAAANDEKRLHIEIHGAKGSLASIGAVDLAEQAEKVEIVAETGDIKAVKTLLPEFLEGLNRLEEQLRTLFVVFSSPKTIIYGNRTQLAARMHKLNLALHTRNEKQIEKIIKSVVTRDFGEEINGQLDKLRICIDADDYAAAAKMVATIVGGLGDGD